ncbi:MAG: AlpA family phage regulatory protein [Desulfomicrobium sp.]|nr:AlpA family phage regulatory protein [Pseudomonadota bacterium]MBV1711773.1 AlpA family phage regulatory protein [Desulfomicrobium sp.]MBU4572639.1 AlpA family phage regulatory protein [Pseudomonadota bacterium]MBU4593580.1 AlpA family phage regulatory protein [Pseudomonadota bacterium]MBV1719165.1 AlpA family phage regulatory protein [Desulfomicrobium sp.]
MHLSATSTSPAFLRLPAVASRLGVHPNTIGNWVRAGQFPPPIKLSSRCHVWSPQEIARFVEQQMEGVE